MVTQSSILAWCISWTEEPDRLQGWRGSMGLHRLDTTEWLITAHRTCIALFASKNTVLRSSDICKESQTLFKTESLLLLPDGAVCSSCFPESCRRLYCLNLGLGAFLWPPCLRSLWTSAVPPIVGWFHPLPPHSGHGPAELQWGRQVSSTTSILASRAILGPT